MSTGTISGQCLEEIETNEIVVTVILEAMDITTLFTFTIFRPTSEAQPDDDVFGLIGTKIGLLSKIDCNKTGSMEPDNPPPPQPTPMPTPQPTAQPTPMPSPSPPPVVMIDDIDGLWRVDCIAEQDPLGIIAGNLGDQVVLNVEIDVNFSTGQVTITTTDGLFILMGMIVDQQNGIFVINAEGNGKLGGTLPTDANILVKAVNWHFVVNELGEIVFTDGIMRFNFPGFLQPNQTSEASCFGEMVGK